MRDLYREIEVFRNLLIETAVHRGSILHHDVIEVSRRLDSLIYQVYISKTGFQLDSSANNGENSKQEIGVLKKV